MKTTTLRNLIIVLAVSLLAMPLVAFAAPRDPHALPNTPLHRNLAARWWQWVLNTPAAQNPLLDTTGEFGAVNQLGPFWFLAGNAGGGTTERTINVPAGKLLFFPIVNEFSTENGTVKEMRAALAADLDTATDLAVEIDGQSVPDLLGFRGQSVIFAIDLPDDNIFGDPSLAGRYAPSVDDGIYLLLAPLPIGQHTIHWHGAITSLGLTLDITYHITVVPR